MAGGQTRKLLALLLAMMPALAVCASPPQYQAQVINPDLVGGRRVSTGGGAVFLVWGSDASILRSENGSDWQHAITPGAADLTQLAANTGGGVLVAVGAKGTLLR